MKSGAWILIGLLTCVAAGWVAYLTLSAALHRETPYADIEAKQEGDDAIVASVGTTLLLEGDIRRSVEYKTLLFEEMATEGGVEPEGVGRIGGASEIEVLVNLVDYIIFLDAAQSGGYRATDEQVDEYITDTRAYCESEDGAPCREIVDKLDMTQEEYWESRVETIRNELSLTNLFYARLLELGMEDMESARDAIEKELREAATVHWRDPVREREYNHYLSIEASREGRK